MNILTEQDVSVYRNITVIPVKSQHWQKTPVLKAEFQWSYKHNRRDDSHLPKAPAQHSCCSLNSSPSALVFLSRLQWFLNCGLCPRGGAQSHCRRGCNQGGGCGAKQSWIIMIFTEKVNRRWLLADIYYTGIELGPFFNVND